MKEKEFDVYGYEEPEGELLKMYQVALCLSADQAEELAMFLKQCAEGMRAHPDWDHEHFNPGAETDIVVSRLQR